MIIKGYTSIIGTYHTISMIIRIQGDNPSQIGKWEEYNQNEKMGNLKTTLNIYSRFRLNIYSRFRYLLVY